MKFVKVVIQCLLEFHDEEIFKVDFLGKRDEFGLSGKGETMKKQDLVCALSLS